MATTICLTIDKTKEVFTAKTDQGYVGCFYSKEIIAITPELFENALQAANAARRMKKTVQQKIKVLSVTQEKAKLLPAAQKKAKSSLLKKSKPKVQKPVKLPTKLYTVEQARAMPLLSFHEVWVIMKGTYYVSDCLNTEAKRIVAFAPERSKAKMFRNHEDAKSTMRTLRDVEGPGYSLKRFFINIE
ncbi:MAG: hypothetical protein ACXABD_12610 [Candidatus Thorarchaeota archaeon]|jgi:hypothetical protein